VNISKQQRWRDHMAAAQEFPGSIDSYCRAKGIQPSAFYYWKRKLGEAKGKSSVPAISRFVPVEVVAGPQPSASLPDPKWIAEFLFHLAGGVR
jgi:hypothetical protein